MKSSPSIDVGGRTLLLCLLQQFCVQTFMCLLKEPSYYIFIILFKNGWVREDGRKGCDCYESYSGMAPIGKATPWGLFIVPSHYKVVRVRFERLF